MTHTLELLVIISFTFIYSPSQVQACPTFCDCQSFEGTKQVATCVLPSITDDVTFDGLNSDLTYWLRIICVDPSQPSNHVSGLLSGLTNLESLDILGCQLGTLTEYSFTGLSSSVTNLIIASSKDITLTKGWLKGIPNIKHLNLSNNNLESMPKESLCSPLISLNLSGNYVEEFDSFGFQCLDDGGCDLCFPNLEVLDISGNDVEEFTTPLLDSMPELREFHAHTNLILFLDPGIFQGLHNLHLIDLSRNEIEEELPDGIFQNLPSLRTVNLRKNILYGVDSDTFDGSPRISSLDLSSNAIEYEVSPDQFDFLHSLTALEYLDLSDNELGALPSNILDNKPNLKTLRILFARIQTLPDGLFAGAPNLESLNLGGNWITELSGNLFNFLEKLQILVLAACSISSVDDNAFQNVPNLQKLYLFRNRLSSVPSALTKLTKLKTLYLNDNDLNEINPNVFSAMSSLETVFLDENPLGSLSGYAFGSNSNIQAMDLSYSKISDVDDDAFKGMPMLKHLWLNSNQMAQLGQVFHQLESVKELDLSFNSIQRIESTPFPYSLNSVNLSSNHISFVSEHAFDDLDDLKVVDLSNNDIRRFPPSLVNTNADPPPEIRLFNNIQHGCNCASVQDGSTQRCSEGYIFEGGTQMSFSEYIQRKDIVCDYDSTCDPETCNCCFQSECACKFSCPSDCICAQNFDSSYQSVSCTDLGLTHIPDNFPESLTHLDLHGSIFTSTERNDFNRYQNLLKLDLSTSDIHEVKPNSFEYLTLLQELSLANNNIQNIYSGTFNGLENLRRLELQNNNMRMIEPGTLSSLHSLEELMLHDNNLTSIELSILSVGIPGMKISLHNNNWVCDCKFGAYLERWLRKSGNKLISDERLVCGDAIQSSFAESGTDLSQVDFSNCSLPEEESETAETKNSQKKLRIILGVTVSIVSVAVIIAIVFIVKKMRKANLMPKIKNPIFHKHMGRTWKSNDGDIDFSSEAYRRSVYDMVNLSNTETGINFESNG